MTFLELMTMTEKSLTLAHSGYMQAPEILNLLREAIAATINGGDFEVVLHEPVFHTEYFCPHFYNDCSSCQAASTEVCDAPGWIEVLRVPNKASRKTGALSLGTFQAATFLL